MANVQTRTPVTPIQNAVDGAGITYQGTGTIREDGVSLNLVAALAAYEAKQGANLNAALGNLDSQFAAETRERSADGITTNV